MDKSSDLHQVHTARKRLRCTSNTDLPDSKALASSPPRHSLSPQSQPAQKYKQPGDHLIIALLERQQAVPPWWEIPHEEKGPREGTLLCFCPQGTSLTQNSLNMINKPAPCSRLCVSTTNSQTLTATPLQDHKWLTYVYIQQTFGGKLPQTRELGRHGKHRSPCSQEA